MNKNNTLFRSAGSLAIIAALVFSIMLVPAESYADSVPASMNVNLTLPATTLDITVSNAVQLTGTAGSTALTGNSITVKNNTIGKVKLDSIAFDKTSNDWTLVEDTSDFDSMAWNQKKFSLKSGTNDFAKTKSMTINQELANSGETGDTSTEISFSGHTGAATTAVGSSEALTIANMIVTVSAVTSAQ